MSPRSNSHPKSALAARFGRKWIVARAEHLCRNHRVLLVSYQQAFVIGDRDTYEVVRLGQRWSCTCPWARLKAHWTGCAHVTAVRMALKDPSSQVPVARLTEMLHAATHAAGGSWA